MKQIQAFIRPEKLDAVKDALVDLGINGITATSVKGFGRQLGQPEAYRGVKIEARFLPKVMLTLVIPDSSVDKVVKSIVETASTGNVGDGKIIVTNVEQAIRIRTGESGDDVVS